MMTGEAPWWHKEQKELQAAQQVWIFDCCHAGGIFLAARAANAYVSYSCAEAVKGETSDVSEEIAMAVLPASLRQLHEAMAMAMPMPPVPIIPRRLPVMRGSREGVH